MLSLSTTTGYAIKALMCLENGGCLPRHISDVASCAGVPRAYLAKILNALALQGLVETKRGCRGGISLARKAEEITEELRKLTLASVIASKKEGGRQPQNLLHQEERPAWGCPQPSRRPAARRAA